MRSSTSSWIEWPINRPDIGRSARVYRIGVVVLAVTISILVCRGVGGVPVVTRAQSAERGKPRWRGSPVDPVAANLQRRRLCAAAPRELGMEAGSTGTSSRMDAGAGPRGRLARLAAQLRPRPCAAQPIASSDAGAIEAYLREGAARARALGNRGPIRFDDEGRIAADILESYYEHGFYVCTNVVQGAELQALIAEFEAMLDNAPAGAEPWKSTNDRYGRPVRQPGAYALTKPLSDPFGATDFGVYDFDKGEAGVPRHPIKMSEPTASAEAPAAVVSSIVHPLLYLDGALHLYGHPQLLAMAEALNGPDFTPFTEASFHKPAGFGSSTAWHQDPSSAWDEDWAAGRLEVGHCGTSFHCSLYECTVENALWILPGSHLHGRADIAAMAEAAGGTDRLPGAVPVLCGPGDVFLQNRMALHCAFANQSPDPRMTIQFGFNRRRVVEGKTTKGYAGSQGGLVTYTDEYIDERSRMVQVAISARSQRYPSEEPYSYEPYRGREGEAVWSEGCLEGTEFWLKDIVV